MIIDCHGHYTTAPEPLQLFREAQIKAFKERKLKRLKTARRCLKFLISAMTKFEKVLRKTSLSY